MDLTARCYDFDGRGPNLLFCGLTPYEVSFYNGTVEGQAAVDTSRNVLYLGRGDGKRYTIDPGRIRWRYVTFNPELPDDPDGGGEVVTAPLLGPDGTVYFGTWGEGDYETHAFYAVNPDSTQLVLGIALREVDGQTQRLYVTTANVRQLNAKEDGMLHAVDPASGAVLANYDPSDDVPEAIGSINSPAIGANGTVYFGVRGRFGNNPVNAHYFAVTYEEAAAQFTRLWNVEVAGLVE